MAKTDFKSVDDYIATQPDISRGILSSVRGTIRAALPDAREVISYQIPAYKLPQGTVIFFAGWKQHYSLYPLTSDLVAAFRDELAACEVSKGTVRFPLMEPVPIKLIERIARFRAQEVIALAEAKAAAPRKRRTAQKAAAGAAVHETN